MTFHTYVKKPIQVKAERLSGPMKMITLEGTFHGKKGDYLVVGVKGERYIVRKDIFEQTYDRFTTP
jgi:hypothetical protein